MPIIDGLLIILRGKENDLEQTYSAFYNFGGTTDHPRIVKRRGDSHLRCDGELATFVSSVAMIKTFFKNKIWHKDWENWQKFFKGKKGGITPQDEKDFELACIQKAKGVFAEFLKDSEDFRRATKKSVGTYIYDFMDGLSAVSDKDGFVLSPMTGFLRCLQIHRARVQCVNSTCTNAQSYFS